MGNAARDSHEGREPAALPADDARPFREMLFGLAALGLMAGALMPLVGTVRKLTDNAVVQQLLALIF